MSLEDIHVRREELIQRIHDAEAAREAEDYEMKMPETYVDITSDEMEYTGGWSWKEFAAAVTVGALIGAAIAIGTPMFGFYSAGSSIGTAIGSQSGLLGVAMSGAAKSAGVAVATYLGKETFNSIF